MFCVFFVIIGIGLGIFMAMKDSGMSTNDIWMSIACFTGVVIVVVLLGWGIIAIVESNKSPEQRKQEAEHHELERRREEERPAREAKEKETRALIQAAQELEQYKKIHGRYPTE